MKRVFQLMMMLLASVTSFSCGGNDVDEGSPSAPTTSSVNLLFQSIDEGAELDAKTTTMLSLTYNSAVRLTGTGITLNGVNIKATSNAAKVEIPLALEAGNAYILKMEKGSVISASDATASAPEFTLNFSTKGVVQPGTTENEAITLAKRLGWGWNLGNHFDTSSGEDGKHPQWGYWDKATPTSTLYFNLKQAGVSTVRICVTWGNYQNTQTWEIESDYMAEVKQNVEWAEAVGLNVILNLHHDEYWLDIKGAANNSTLNTAIKERIEKTWKQIAEIFKDKGDFLFFESFNEIQDGKWGWGDNRTDGGKQYKTLNEWNQLVVNTIRETGSNNATRWIGIPGYASSPTFVLDENFVLPTDAANRLMVSVHFYDPSNFTLTPENNDGKSEWGHTAASGKFQGGSNEDHVVDVFGKLYEKFIAKNIPVYIGEYGCVKHTTERSNLFRNYYLEYVCRAAHTYKMPVCVWDNNVTGGGNEHHAYFNHNDGTYQEGMEPVVQTMIKAATSDDTNYTLDVVYSNAPK